MGFAPLCRPVGHFCSGGGFRVGGHDGASGLVLPFDGDLVRGAALGAESVVSYRKGSVY